MITTKNYKLMWRFLDGVSDFIVVISILITLFAWLYESFELILSKFSLLAPFAFDINQALKIALNSVVIVKIYETLKLFISHEQLSLTYIMELGLIGLWVKLFFDESFLSIEKAGIFAIVFVCYVWLKWYEHHIEKCDISPGSHSHKH